MSVKRIQVKQRLALERTILRQGRSVLVCDLCGKEGPSDLHEVLVERDDVKGPEMLARITEAPENLQFLCNTPCNIKLAKMDFHRQALILRQVERFGRWKLNEVLPGAAKRYSPQQRERLVAIFGEHVLTEWIYDLGMTDPEPYVRRIEAVTQALYGGETAEELMAWQTK